MCLANAVYCGSDAYDDRCYDFWMSETTGGDDTPPTGGDDTPPTGGDTDPPTGGDTDPPTGGDDTPPTGDDSDPATGGDTDPATGDDSDPATGGDSFIIRGPVESVAYMYFSLYDLNMDGKIDYDEVRSATDALEEVFTKSWAFDYNDWI